MKFPVAIACAAAAMMLSACAGAGMVHDAQPVPVVSGFTPIATPTLPANFCQGAATSDRRQAESSGFDSATLDRIAMQSLQQCRTLLAGVPGTDFERMAAR
jgi:hypothetical protein